MGSLNGTMAIKGYVPLGNAAKKLSKSKQALYYWIEEGKIHGVKMGSRWYVNWKSVVDYYRQQDPNSVKLLGLE